MFVQKRTLQIVLLLMFSVPSNYSMECNEYMDESSIEGEYYEYPTTECQEPEKPEVSQKYLEDQRRKIKDYIQNLDLNGFSEVLQKLSLNLTSKDLTNFLISEDQPFENRPISMADSLPANATKKAIEKKLQSYGAPILQQEDDENNLFGNFDRNFSNLHKRLMQSIKIGSLAQVKEVIYCAYAEWGLTVYSINDTCGKNPIHNIFHIKVLLNQIDKESGHTPLTMAIEENLKDIVRLLLSTGSDYNTPNLAGKKPVDIAQDKLGMTTEEFYEAFKIEKPAHSLRHRYLALEKDYTESNATIEQEMLQRDEELNSIRRRMRTTLRSSEYSLPSIILEKPDQKLIFSKSIYK